ncbi:MAG: DEAD/DEAH box helicase family protein [Deltaproteobacteria bacterium]|nr:DEAD/DEAH box helicase family protein [Deltaproteobacteria bacterium]
MTLHFKFEPNLDFQWQAVGAVCDLFRGQEIGHTEFTVLRPAEGPQVVAPYAHTDLGIGNSLHLLRDDVQANLGQVQLRNGLRPTELPEGNELRGADFTVEMETGTGKTYVYLRTIFELNKRYGFTKFIIVVPSVAIKEGVQKTLQITQDHFRGLYAGVPFGWFLYDSGKLGQVRNFATSPNIEIMVVTVGAINKKDVNNIYGKGANEGTGGERPIDLLRATRPILIVDEPQSVDGGLEGRGKEALQAMDPLCTLRYSATHVDKHHMVYRLDAVDAYERKLVKQIEVAAATVEEAYNKPYVKLVKVENKKGKIGAKVELNVQKAGRVGRELVTVRDGDDLSETTKLPIYGEHRIGEIRVERGNEYVELRVPGDQRFLRLGEAHGDVDALAVQRQMIRRTITEHLDKEKRLRPLGIKVLSLFFIDAVEKYRRYEDGKPVKGEYALLFEEEYRRACKLPAYTTLFREVDLGHAAEEIHDGYFSIDKKGAWTDTDEGNQTSRDNAERAYSLIMQEKEKLLLFETPLKFIFSHSALREGWDNPNVFQICSLRDIASERERRQTIGRGLRLCVNQQGDRLRGFEINTLTVIANESYQDFADNLQREIEEDTGIVFGVVEDHQFAAVPIIGADGQATPLGFDQSKALWAELRAQGYLNPKGKVEDSLRKALRDGKVVLPAAFEPQREAITRILRKAAGHLEIKDANARHTIPVRRAVLESAEFKALWNRIKHKTTYRVRFDNPHLVQSCTEALRGVPEIPKTHLQWRKAELAIDEGGVGAKEKAGAATVTLDEPVPELPDVLGVLQDRTQLTRRSLGKILVDSGRLPDLRRNPQAFLQLAAEAINRCKRLAVVDGIKYQRLGDDCYYAQELFDTKELQAYLENCVEAGNSVYEKVVCDSETERLFAEQLANNNAVKVFAKLPGWFTVQTPLGGYNPDWAIVVETDEGQKLYFVVETKSGLFADDLRAKEQAKIDCGKAHFQALRAGEEPAEYRVAHCLDDVLAVR